jgi:hypothetical protein
METMVSTKIYYFSIRLFRKSTITYHHTHIQYAVIIIII